MEAPVTRFAVSLDKGLFEKFENLRIKKGYVSRSEAVRALIRNQLVEENWDEKKETMGTITLVYDHHVSELSESLTDTQHDYHKLIISMMHVHLDPDNCLEVLVVKGKGEAIREVADKLISTKGVKHGKLTLTTAGSELS